jgi:hypothetical protein
MYVYISSHHCPFSCTRLDREGFIGGFFFTMLWALWFPSVLVGFQWLTCPAQELALWPEVRVCVHGSSYCLYVCVCAWG